MHIYPFQESSLNTISFCIIKSLFFLLGLTMQKPKTPKQFRAFFKNKKQPTTTQTLSPQESTTFQSNKINKIINQGQQQLQSIQNIFQPQQQQKATNLINKVKIDNLLVNQDTKSQQSKWKPYNQKNNKDDSMRTKKILAKLKLKQSRKSDQNKDIQAVQNQKQKQGQKVHKTQQPLEQQKYQKGKNKPARGHYKIFNAQHFDVKEQIKTSVHRWQYGMGETPRKLLISSWNVNGIRARTNANDILPYIESTKPDIFCINQHKLDLKSYLQNPIKFWGYYSYWNFPKYSLGYSGVAIFSKYPAKQMFQDLHVAQYSKEGRVITLEFDKFILVNVYIPTCGRQLQRLKYRVQEYDPAFKEYILKLKKRYPQKTFIICGDINVAHKDLDCHVGKRMMLGKDPAFTFQQRNSFSQFLKQANMMDTFRQLHPDSRQYTWWNMRRGGRQRAGQTGIGKRLDYFLINQQSFKYVQTSQIKKEVKGCDHCPIQLCIHFE